MRYVRRIGFPKFRALTGGELPHNSSGFESTMRGVDWTFRLWPQASNGSVALTRAQLSMLFAAPKRRRVPASDEKVIGASKGHAVTTP